MKTSNSFFGKMLYGLLFTIALPMLLWYWARQTESAVHYKAVHAPGWGIGLSTAGLILIGWGILALWRYGHGLPMNAYPPDAFVTRGPYRLFRHPIYWGFGFFVAGVSLAVGSASGLWLVTPVTALGMAALVWGYERLDLQERFPGAEMQTWLAAPPA
ncbi:MAG: diacylglyceryl transferase, partial [Bacteroidetes bacterium]